MSPHKRRQLLADAQSVAEQRATQWAVYRTDSQGNRLTGWKLVQADSRERALRKVRRPTGASPILPSSGWRDVYREVGLC